MRSLSPKMKRRNEEIDGESETNELLVELEECFGSSEKYSEGMLEKLAKDTNDGLRSKLNRGDNERSDRTTSETKNLDNLKPPSVNNEIWSHLDRNVKKNQDLKLSKTQTLICKTTATVNRFEKKVRKID